MPDPLGDGESEAAGPDTVAPSHSFTLEIGLGDVEGHQDEVRAEIGTRIDGELVVRQDSDGVVVVTLTVPAIDLWLSLLQAMATVTQTGYVPRSVEAMPTEDYERRRLRRREAA